MANALYLLDCYLKEFEASVESVKDDKYAVLDKTAFYPNAGGQPYDTGKLVRLSDGAEFSVVFVAKFGDVISHEFSPTGLKPGDKVKGIIDWDRRYRHMRMHTAAHVISIVIEKDAGALITGNQLGLDKSRIDFDLENFDREKFEGYMAKANELIQKGAKVNLSLIPREEALQKYERLTNLAKGFSDEIKMVRIVEIEGVTLEACGGTHLANINEIKGVKLVKLENKGKSNRRLYYELVD